MNKLVNYAEKQKQGRPLRLEEIADEQVVINGVVFTEGRLGRYAVMDIVTVSGEKAQAMSGARLVLDALDHAVEQKAFPCSAVFSKRGRVWVIS
jgi:hypothetical protein